MRMIPGLRTYRMLGGHRNGTLSEPDLPVAAGAGPVCWLHATDPGEYDALKLLAAQMADLRGGPECLVTGGGARPGPGEGLRAIHAWLERLQPTLLVLAGPVLPPNLIDAAQARGIALILVNTDHASAPGRWGLWPGMNRALLSFFTQIHTRTEAAARTLEQQMRGVNVLHGGTLARFAPALPCNHVELAALRQVLDGRPVWFAFSPPESEVDAALAAHTQALRRAHRLLLILAPRDARRGGALAARAIEMGFACARRTTDDDIIETTQIYIADAEDEPGLFLRLAPVSYLGGSLTPDAGTPGPVPAAALGSALVFGPHGGAGNCAFLEQLHRLGGGRRIAAPGELGEAISALLSPETGAEAALKAWTLATEGSDATYQVARALCDWVQLNRMGTA